MNLIFEFQDGSLITTNLYYRYNTHISSWEISTDNEKWYVIGDTTISILSLTSNNEGFISSLKGKNFLEGLFDLVNRTTSNKEGGLFNAKLKTNKVSMDHEGIITVSQQGATDLYFKFGDKHKWIWSPDKTNWMEVETTIVSGGRYNGQQPVEKNQNIINSLKNVANDKKEGLGIIFKLGNQ